MAARFKCAKCGWINTTNLPKCEVCGSTDAHPFVMAPKTVCVPSKSDLETRRPMESSSWSSLDAGAKIGVVVWCILGIVSCLSLVAALFLFLLYLLDAIQVIDVVGVNQTPTRPTPTVQVVPKIATAEPTAPSGPTPPLPNSTGWTRCSPHIAANSQMDAQPRTLSYSAGEEVASLWCEMRRPRLYVSL